MTGDSHCGGATTLVIGVVLAFFAAVPGGAVSASRAARHHSGVTPPTVPSVCPDANLTPTASNLAAIDRATICLVNRERVRRGLVALAENVKLDRAAVRHSRSMIAHDFFNDIGPAGQTVKQRTLATGYGRAASRFRVGQNVAIGTSGADSPAEIVAAWMNQSEHRAVILRAFYRETGVGASAALPAGFFGGRPGATYTQVFGVIGPR